MHVQYYNLSFLHSFTEDPLAGLNKHELLRALVRQETKDAATQTDEIQGGNDDHPLFQSLLQGLEEIVHTGLTTSSWNDGNSLEITEQNTDSSESGVSESAAEEFGKC